MLKWAKLLRKRRKVATEYLNEADSSSTLEYTYTSEDTVHATVKHISKLWDTKIHQTIQNQSICNIYDRIWFDRDLKEKTNKIKM